MKKAKKRPDFAQNTIHPSPGFRSLRSEGLATAYAVPFPSFSVSKAFMSETETVSFCIIAHPYESKLSRMGYYAKTPHLRAALIIALHCAEREGFEPPEPLSSTVFKTAVIDHSTISPFPFWDCKVRNFLCYSKFFLFYFPFRYFNPYC